MGTQPAVYTRVTAAAPDGPGVKKRETRKTNS